MNGEEQRNSRGCKQINPSSIEFIFDRILPFFSFFIKGFIFQFSLYSYAKQVFCPFEHRDAMHYLHVIT